MNDDRVYQQNKETVAFLLENQIPLIYGEKVVQLNYSTLLKYKKKLEKERGSAFPPQKTREALFPMLLQVYVKERYTQEKSPLRIVAEEILELEKFNETTTAMLTLWEQLRFPQHPTLCSEWYFHPYIPLLEKMFDISYHTSKPREEWEKTVRREFFRAIQGESTYKFANEWMMDLSSRVENVSGLIHLFSTFLSNAINREELTTFRLSEWALYNCIQDAIETKLGEKDQFIVMSYFGLKLKLSPNPHKKLSMKELAEKFACTSSSISEHLNKSLRKIRNEVAEALYPEAQIRELLRENDLLKREIKDRDEKKEALLKKAEAQEQSEKGKSEKTFQEVREFLLTPLEKFVLSKRTRNCLEAADAEYPFHICQYGWSGLMKFRNMGKKSVRELQCLFSQYDCILEEVSKETLDACEKFINM